MYMPYQNEIDQLNYSQLPRKRPLKALPAGRVTLFLKPNNIKLLLDILK